MTENERIYAKPAERAKLPAPSNSDAALKSAEAQIEREIESQIDHVVDDSFPASDPPAWDSLRERSAREKAEATRARS